MTDPDALLKLFAVGGPMIATAVTWVLATRKQASKDGYEAGAISRFARLAAEADERASEAVQRAEQAEAELNEHARSAGRNEQRLLDLEHDNARLERDLRKVLRFAPEQVRRVMETNFGGLDELPPER